MTEEKARKRIDEQLREAGWEIVTRDEYTEEYPCAVKEALMQGNKESDYLLFVEKREFVKKAKISSASLAKLGKGANVTTDILVKICEELNCDIGDICEVVSDAAPDEKTGE